MAVSMWTEADSDRARQIGAEYQRDRDVELKAGQTAGMDPLSGRVWIGDSIEDVVEQQDSAGSQRPLFFERVGSETYYRKARYEQLADRNVGRRLDLHDDHSWPFPPRY